MLVLLWRMASANLALRERTRKLRWVACCGYTIFVRTCRCNRRCLSCALKLFSVWCIHSILLNCHFARAHISPATHALLAIIRFQPRCLSGVLTQVELFASPFCLFFRIAGSFRANVMRRVFSGFLPGCWRRCFVSAVPCRLFLWQRGPVHQDTMRSWQISGSFLI